MSESNDTCHQVVNILSPWPVIIWSLVLTDCGVDHACCAFDGRPRPMRPGMGPAMWEAQVNFWQKSCSSPALVHPCPIQYNTCPVDSCSRMSDWMGFLHQFFSGVSPSVFLLRADVK